MHSKSGRLPPKAVELTCLTKIKSILDLPTWKFKLASLQGTPKFYLYVKRKQYKRFFKIWLNIKCIQTSSPSWMAYSYKVALAVSFISLTCRYFCFIRYQMSLSTMVKFITWDRLIYNFMVTSFVPITCFLCYISEFTRYASLVNKENSSYNKVKTPHIHFEWL